MFNVTFISSIFTICYSCWWIYWYLLSKALVFHQYLLGELRILNTANEGDPLVASSDLVDMAHKEPIAQLSWLQSSKGYCIISLGNDGKLLLWNWKSSKLEAIQTFGLKSTCIPSNLKISRSDVVAELGG